MDRVNVKVVEYTDAMCSWAWGTEPKLRLLRWRFDDQIREWRQVMGHLVEDDHMPQRDAAAEAPKLEGYWKVVCDQTGMARPAPLHRATSGSQASGLTVKAAQRQNDRAADLVLRRLREATFVEGEPPDSLDRAIDAGRGLDGVDHDLLADDARGSAVVEAYQRDQDETRTPNDYVLTLEGDQPGIGRARQARDGRMRFVFPTLVISGEGNETTVPGWMPYEDYEAALFKAGAQPTDRTAAWPTPEDAFARWPSLTDHELAFLCGPDAGPPAGTVTHRWAGGTLHMTPGEATARRLAA